MTTFPILFYDYDSLVLLCENSTIVSNLNFAS